MRIHLLFLIAAFASPAFSAEVKVLDFHQSQPQGILGAPLGSKLVIEGHKPDKPLLMAAPLVVTKIGDILLKKEIIITTKSDFRLEKDVHYKFEGYEGGCFSGDPDWLHSGAQQSFSYRPFFVVTRVMKTEQGAAANP